MSEQHATVTFPFVLASSEVLPLTLSINGVASSGSFTVSFNATDNSVS
jgi:hypothetical protein